MTLVIDVNGEIRCLYEETIDLAALGRPTITRASQVDPDEAGRWWSDMAAVDGPKLGPFAARSEALAAERQWLQERYLGGLPNC